MLMALDIAPERLPRHVAIIMDGNGRWAEQRNKPRIFGHVEGAKTVKNITEECARLGLTQLTLYAFSHENWQRPLAEVDYLMGLLARFLLQERKTFLDNNIRLTAIGDVERLPHNVLRELQTSQSLSANNSGMTLCLALSYGSRVEILKAVKKIATKVAQGDLHPDEIDEESFRQYLYQPDMPDPDLLIRTGGEMRISNFLLWQIAYAEIWVTPRFWPDFQIADLHQAIRDFSQRERRFGKVTPKIPLPQMAEQPRG